MCGMDLKSCESTQEFLDQNRLKIWHQTRDFDILQVVLCYGQMRLVMGNKFARVRSGTKLILA